MKKEYLDIKKNPLEPKKFYTLESDKKGHHIFLTSPKGIPKDIYGQTPKIYAGFVLITHPKGYIQNLEIEAEVAKNAAEFISSNLEKLTQPEPPAILSSGRGQKPRHQRGTNSFSKVVQYDHPVDGSFDDPLYEALDGQGH